MDKKGIVIANIICITILAGMYIYTDNVSPENADIGEIGKYAGKYVSVSGIVEKIKNESTGSVIILVDESMKNSVMVFSSFHPGVFPGSTVRVRGIVERYSNLYEIKVRKSSDFRILKRSYRITLKILLKNPEYFVGFRLNIHGNITGVKRTYRYIHITDGVNAAWIYVGNGYRGERKLYFYGVVKNGMLYVDNVSLKEKKGYENVSVGEISKYEGKRIGVWGKILNYGEYGYIQDGRYRLEAFFKREVKDANDVYVRGTFVYDEKIGEYEIICN